MSRWWQGRFVERAGVALLAAILVLLIVGSLAVGAYLTTVRRARAGLALRAADTALYAAEAGLQSALIHWPPTAAELAPGRTSFVTSGRLATGAEYTVRVTRLDGGEPERLTGLFMISAVGRAPGPAGGRRRLAWLARAGLPLSECCSAALSAPGDLELEGARVAGDDVTAGVVAECESANPGPGWLTDAVSRLRSPNGDALRGDPPLLRDGGALRARLAALALRLPALAELADIRLPGGSVVSGLRPRRDAAGDCARADIHNWGAPGRPAHPCADYYPVIHVAGDLTLLSAGEGQGILVVEGDLDVHEDVRFHGLLLVGGRLYVRGRPGAPVELVGATALLNPSGTPNRLDGVVRILYSPCARDRAITGSSLYRPRPLAERAWLQIFR